MPESIMIYNRLSVLRAERGLSRQELADAVGVNYQTIGYLERGRLQPEPRASFQTQRLLQLAYRGHLFDGAP